MKAHHTQRGSVSLMVAFLLPVFLGLAALAIDLVYLQIVRNEMQNDADAAALAGAHALVDPNGGAVRWADATAQAQQSVSLNRAAGQPLSDAQVQTGYWNLTGQPTGLQPQSLAPTVWDAPAVRVTVRKATGQNQGPVQTFFARFWSGYGRYVFNFTAAFITGGGGAGRRDAAARHDAGGMGGRVG